MIINPADVREIMILVIEALQDLICGTNGIGPSYLEEASDRLAIAIGKHRMPEARLYDSEQDVYKAAFTLLAMQLDLTGRGGYEHAGMIEDHATVLKSAAEFLYRQNDSEEILKHHERGATHRLTFGWISQASSGTVDIKASFTDVVGAAMMELTPHQLHGVCNLIQPGIIAIDSPELLCVETGDVVD